MNAALLAVSRKRIFFFHKFKIFQKNWGSIDFSRSFQGVGPGTSDQSLFRLQNEFRKIPLPVIYYLTKFDDVT